MERDIRVKARRQMTNEATKWKGLANQQRPPEVRTNVGGVDVDALDPAERLRLANERLQATWPERNDVIAHPHVADHAEIDPS